MAKRRIHHTHRPVCVHGKVTLEFFGNADEQFKASEMTRLVKALRKELQISACTVEDQIVENPERATLAFALVGQTIDQARRLQDQALRFVDEKAPARIVDESIHTVDLEY